MKSVFQYFKERFPIQLVVVLSASYSLMLLGVIGHLTNNKVRPSILILVTLSFAAFLLRLRVTDEFKDLDHDKKNYPNRPLQRGLISPKKLITLGICAFIIELGTIYAISPLAIMYYIPVLIYSVLTAKEFFVSPWLNRHFNAYLLTHQFIFVIFSAWGYWTFGVLVTIQALFGLIAFILTMFIFEIIRKLEYRHDRKGKIVKDSYPAVWGAPGTIALLILMTTCVGLLLTVITGNTWHILIALMAVLFTYSGRFKLIQTVIGISLTIQGILLLV